MKGYLGYLINVIETDDDESIKCLSQKTAKCFTNDRVRLLFIRAQVVRIDLKIDLAMAEVMRIYRQVLKSSSCVAAVPFANTTNRVAASVKPCQTIITCFGIPSVNAKTASTIIKTSIWDDLGNGVDVMFAEALSTIGALTSLFIPPAILLPATLNVPLVVPAAARLLLRLSCDLILICIRAFREAVARGTQPSVKDVQKAAYEYRAYATNVHARVADLLPKRNVIKCFRKSSRTSGPR